MLTFEHFLRYFRTNRKNTSCFGKDLSWERFVLGSSLFEHELPWVWVRVVLGMSCLGYESPWEGTSCPGYELSWVRVVLGTSRLGYELSWVRVVLGTRCLGYELSWVRVVLGTRCLGYELTIIPIQCHEQTHTHTNQLMIMASRNMYITQSVMSEARPLGLWGTAYNIWHLQYDWCIVAFKASSKYLESFLYCTCFNRLSFHQVSQQHLNFYNLC